MYIIFFGRENICSASLHCFFFFVHVVFPLLNIFNLINLSYLTYRSCFDRVFDWPTVVTDWIKIYDFSSNLGFQNEK